MFARGSYPTSKAFYMTYRFDLKDSVDPQALTHPHVGLPRDAGERHHAPGN